MYDSAIIDIVVVHGLNRSLAALAFERGGTSAIFINLHFTS